MKLKKLLCVLMVIALAVGAFACAKPAVQDPPPAGEPATDEPATDEPATDEPAVVDPEPAADDGTVYKFNVSFAAPEFSTTEITAALNRIKEASNGRIEFTYYYSWSITSVPTVVDDLVNGVCDIAAVPIHEHLNTFPYSTLISYTPFLGLPGMLEGAKIFDEMYDEYPQLQEEYAKLGLHYWTNYPCPGYNIYTTSDKQIRTPADLNGLKLITSSRLMQEFITANGGAPVNVPVTDYATNLQTSVAHGAINHVNVMRAFGCIDFIKGGTLFGENGEAGTTISLMIMCLSEKAWNSLPADLQALFEAEAEALRDNQGGWDKEANTGNHMGMIGDGVPLITLTDDEVKVWSDAFAEILDGYIADLVAAGATDAQLLYDAVKAKIAAY